MNNFIENKSLVPAPANTCPEDDESVPDAFDCANTHGRDSFARRLLPAMLKDDLSPLSYDYRSLNQIVTVDEEDAKISLAHIKQSIKVPSSPCFEQERFAIR